MASQKKEIQKYFVVQLFLLYRSLRSKKRYLTY